MSEKNIGEDKICRWFGRRNICKVQYGQGSCGGADTSVAYDSLVDTKMENSRIVWPSMLRLTMWWCGSAHVSLVELMWQPYNSHVVVCGLDNDGQRGKAAVDFRVGESVVTCWLPLHYLQLLQHRNRGRERGFSSVLP